MMSQNVQNKAAIKNNENQQTVALANSQAANAKAFNQQQMFNGAPDASTAVPTLASVGMGGQHAGPAPATPGSMATPVGVHAPIDPVVSAAIQRALSQGAPPGPIPPTSSASIMGRPG